jgi:MraZ protein
MLVGTYEHKVDSKGRTVLPAKFRQELGQCVVATIGIDQCVSIYPMSNWSRVLEKLQELPFSKSKSRGLMRVMLASAHELPIDSAGRILIPQLLRDHASLQSDALFVGVSDHIELWDKELWNIYSLQIMEELPAIAEEIEGF